MKTISVQQPWAWAIFRGAKDVENRHNKRGQDAARKQFAHHGRLLIHTSQRDAGPDAARQVRELAGVDALVNSVGDPAWAYGAVIGIVTVQAIHTSADCGDSCSPWAQPGAAHLVLTDPRLLRHPIAVPGRLGLWTVDDPLVLAAISRELA